MTNQKYSEDQIRKIVKEEFSSLIAEYNLSDEDIQVLDRQLTHEDARKTGATLNVLGKIKDMVVYGVNKAGVVVALIVCLYAHYGPFHFFSEIMFPGSVPDATEIARLIRSKSLTLAENVSKDIQNAREEFVVVSDEWFKLSNDEYRRTVDTYIENEHRIEELLMDKRTTIVSIDYVPEGIVNRSIASSSSSSSSLAKKSSWSRSSNSSSDLA
jgi:hypothetical protein